MRLRTESTLYVPSLLFYLFVDLLFGLNANMCCELRKRRRGSTDLIRIELHWTCETVLDQVMCVDRILRVLC